MDSSWKIAVHSSSDMCCVCLKIVKGCDGIHSQYMYTADGTPVRVCSSGCEQDLLFSSGFTKGFVLCNVLSQLFGSILVHRRTKSDVSSLHSHCREKSGNEQILASAPENSSSSVFVGVSLSCGKSAGQSGIGHDSCHESFTVETGKATDDTERDEQIPVSAASCRKAKRLIKNESNVSSTKRTLRDKTGRASNYGTIFPSKPVIKQPKNLNHRVQVQNKRASRSRGGDCKNHSKSTGCKRRDSAFVCTCGKVLNSEKLYTHHQQACGYNRQNVSHDKSLTPSCHICTGVFQSRWHLNYHMKRKHSGETSIECDKCGKVLNGMFDLKEHKRKAHSINYLCHTCGKKFFSSNALAGHLATHSGVKSHFCEECGAGFVRKTSLTNHQALHVKVSAFLCDVCSQSFKTRTRLYDHMMNVHHCGPYFDNRVRRLKAMGITVDREAISRMANGFCTLCGEKLNGGKCSVHFDASQEVFKCTLCGKAESDIVSLYYHSKWHKGEELNSTLTDISFPSHGLLNYECKTCFKKFKNKNYLIKHMQQHKEKRFSCDVCGKSFTYKCNLKSHLTTHSQNRPFECEFCRKAFKLKYTLDVHKKNHCREVNAFKCDICGKGLIRKESLEKHYETVHPDLQPSVSTSAANVAD